jgi:lipocalin-like protein
MNFLPEETMRTFMLTVAVAALAFSPAAAQEDLTGTYKLISSKRRIVETGEVLDTWGKNPKGFITYGKDGRMLVLIVTEDRPRPESVEKITDQQRAQLFRTMTAYGGTYEFDGRTVQHHIDISWNEVWTGTTVVRELKKEGNKLVYSSPAAPFSGDGRMSLVTLVWEKVE